MSKQRCSSKKLSLISFLDLTENRLFGGVLLVFALAFIPNLVYATDYSQPEVITSDYRAARFNSYTANKFGCNTVVSDSGLTAVGPRASLFGADDNPSGCGYYIGHGSDNSGELTWRSGAESGTTSYSYDGDITSNSIPSDIQSYSLNNDDYLSKNFRSSVVQISSTAFDVAYTTGDYYTINAVGQDNAMYGDYIFISYWKVQDGLINSAMTPSVVLTDTETTLTGEALNQFYKDIYNSTSYWVGYPTDDVFPTDLKNYLALYTGFTHVEDWEEYAFIVSYIPQYAQSYQLRKINYRVDTIEAQSTIDQSLGGFSNFVVGLGNNQQSSTYPKLNYIYLGRPYTRDNTWSGEYIIQDLHSIRFNCISATCHDQSVITSKNSINSHNKQVSGWDFGGNNGSSWFDVFKINLIFPFSSFFSSLTDDRCVDIPTIASWLHTSQSHVCTYWDNNIRTTLTPVFMSLASLILFGFIVSWLKGSSSNAFRDNNTTRLGDRF